MPDIIAEFAERINKLAADPDGEWKLEFIGMLLRDPEALDNAYEIFAPYLEMRRANER